MLQGLAKEPALVLDSGNALFRDPVQVDDAARQRAAFILTTMGQLGTRAMAVGLRDLTGGLDFLEATAAKAGVALLSANLTVGGKRPLPGALTVDVKGVKVALIGLTAVGAVPGDKAATAGPTLEAAKRELGKLGKRDLTVLLAATSYADALQLATELKGQVDLVIQSGEPRGNQAPQNVGGVFVLASGQKGQAVGKLALSLGGTGPFADEGEQTRTRTELDYVNGQVRTIEERLAVAKDARGKADLERMLVEMKGRRDEMAKKAGVGVAAGARTLKLDWVLLGADVADDKPLRDAVLKIEPTPPPH